MTKQNTRLIWAIILFLWLCIVAFVTLIVVLQLRKDRIMAGNSDASVALTKAVVDVTNLQRQLRGGAEYIILDYVVDKSAVSPLSFNELTYNIVIGNNQNVQLSSDAGNIPFTQSNGTIQFTTDADAFALTLPNTTLISNLGQLSVTHLKYDKAWAWSHGFDDNVFLNKSIEAFEAHGYRGTLFLILRDVWEDREEDWTLDEPQLGRLLANGWSLGNHSWGHECDVGSTAAYEDAITLGYDRLFEVISRSNRPDYRLMAFAAPCFDDNYHPLILQHRDQRRSQVLFNESGGAYLLRVNSGVTEPVVSEEITAVSFTPDLPIGRDGNVDVATDSILANFDWLSRNATPSQHLWYNTLAHGNNEATVNTILDYLDNNYKEEVWVAPSDEIYSYLLLRDGVRISVRQP